MICCRCRYVTLDARALLRAIRYICYAAATPLRFRRAALHEALHAYYCLMPYMPVRCHDALRRAAADADADMLVALPRCHAADGALRYAMLRSRQYARSAEDARAVATLIDLRAVTLRHAAATPWLFTRAVIY